MVRAYWFNTQNLGFYPHPYWMTFRSPACRFLRQEFQDKAQGECEAFKPDFKHTRWLGGEDSHVYLQDASPEGRKQEALCQVPRICKFMT